MKTDKDFLALAYQYAAKHSSDPRTKNGAVIVDSQLGEIISYGANRFPDGVKQLQERTQPDLKRNYFEHAERDAIFSALRQGKQTMNASMYVPWFACADCAKAIIGAGIKLVVGHKAPSDHIGPWTESINIGLQMLQEAGVAYHYFDGSVGIKDFMFNGELVDR